jgi:hypothetical protein
MGTRERAGRVAAALDAATRALGARWAPHAVGLASAAVTAWVWGSLSAPAFIHDEASYRLQAEIFASGRLSAPPPPLPEFFEQYHVLVTPRLAPKYPPGHALLLVPGVWLGLPGLGPVALAGLAAGLMFACARRLAGGWAALLAWLFWITAPLLHPWRATYMSQGTSTALLMLAAWLLLRWRDARRTRDLVALGVAVAWMGLTRPVTGIAFCIPLALVVLRDVWRRRAWGSLAAAAAAAAVVLGILPVWAAASTGDWRTLPYTLYTRVYFPYEKLGFGVDPAPPLRELPADMQAFDRDSRRIHAVHTTEGLPRTVLARLHGLGREMWGSGAWRAAFVLFFGFGLLVLDRRGWFAVSWALALFFVYLAYAHPPHWAVYYHEIQPILGFLTGLGLWRALGAAGRRWPSRGAEAAAAGFAGLILVLGVADVRAIKGPIQARYAYARGFDQALSAVAEARAIVFVRYGPHHNPHRSLIENPSDHATARIWVARDRGADNLRLMDAAPERAAYLFDEGGRVLYRLQRP